MSGKGDSKHIGAGARGKSDGTGAMTDLQEDLVGENDVLSNRDKTQDSSVRGSDSKFVQVEQYRDSDSNRDESA